MDNILGYIFTISTLFICAYILFHTFKTRNISFWSGICCGFSFFIGGPLFQLLVFGQISTHDLPVQYIDITKDILLLSVIFTFAAMHLLLYHINQKSFSAAALDLPQQNSINHKRHFYLVTLIYLFLALLVFTLSGKSQGGHWIENYGELYKTNAGGVVAGNFYNVLRVSVPGILIYAVLTEMISKKRFIFYILFFAILELYLSSNRIIMLFCLFSLVFVFYKTNKKILYITILFLPALLQFNHLFPIMRGLLWSEGAGVTQLVQSYETAKNSRLEEASGMEDLMTGAFESANLNVIKFVFDHYPEKYSYLWGETVYLKSITFFLPKAIWADKPTGFGSILGPEITGVDILTLNSTLIGEAFGNFGYLSLALMPINFYLASLLFRGLNTGPLRYTSFFIAFAAWRFDFSFLIIGAFVLFLISKSNFWKLSLKRHGNDKYRQS